MASEQLKKVIDIVRSPCQRRGGGNHRRATRWDEKVAERVASDVCCQPTEDLRLADVDRQRGQAPVVPVERRDERIRASSPLR
jgi:hypothetical protein